MAASRKPVPVREGACAAVLVLVSVAVGSGCLQLINNHADDSSATTINSPTASPTPDIFVFGQPSLFETASDDTQRIVGSSTLNYPVSLACGGGYCYLADSGNNRVLIFAGSPSSSSAAIGVIGQGDLTGHLANRGALAPGPGTLSGPYRVVVVGTKLLIADGGNNRVLIFNSLPTTTGAQANLALGQPDLASGNPNQGGSGASASSLNFPSGVDSDGTNVFVADFYNHRVLMWTSFPTSNGAPASLVLGQSGLTGSAANAGGSVGPGTLYYPGEVTLSGSQLLVADYYNNRVLIWSSLPTSNQQSPNVVVGQTGMTSSGGGTSASQLSYPWSATVDSGKLYVADSGNSRVLVWNSVPSANGASANAALGQTSLTAGSSNQGLAAPSASTLSYPVRLVRSGSQYFVVDDGNSRLLVYNSAPVGGAAADDVFGQTGFANRNPNGMSVPNAYGFDWPGYLSFWGNQWMIVSDKYNNRVLFLDKTQPGAPAQYVLGQPNFTSNQANRGGSAAANTINYARGLAVYGNQLYFADSGNNRVLVYDLTQLANGMNASYVIGQASMTGASANQGGAPSAYTLSAPQTLQVYGSMLYVSDYSNYRVLGYPLPITSSNSAATLVYGQSSFTSVTSATDQQHVAPMSMLIQGNTLVMGGSTRTLFFSPIPASATLSNAVGVFGQNSYTALSSNRGLAAPDNNTLGCCDLYVGFVNNYFLQSDKNNGRILVFQGMPVGGTNIAADYVIGKPSFTAQNNAPIGAYLDSSGNLQLNLYGPVATAVDSGYLYIADAWGERVLKINLSALPNYFRH